MLASLHAILTLTSLASILLLILLTKPIFSCRVNRRRFLTVLSRGGQEGAVLSSSSFVVIMVMTICDDMCCLREEWECATGATNPGADVPDARVFVEFRAIRIIGR